MSSNMYLHLILVDASSEVFQLSLFFPPNLPYIYIRPDLSMLLLLLLLLFFPIERLIWNRQCPFRIRAHSPPSLSPLSVSVYEFPVDGRYVLLIDTCSLIQRNNHFLKMASRVFVFCLFFFGWFSASRKLKILHRTLFLP